MTGYGAQGITVDEALQLVDDGTDRPGFYVGATRGRYANQTALVAENADPDLARRGSRIVTVTEGQIET